MLMQALELAREQGDNIKDQIWRELAKARCAAQSHTLWTVIQCDHAQLALGV